jgi:hypothetical protein
VWQSVGPFQHMPHRELLTESQRLSLQAPASDERGMVRHYTLSSEDLALINRRRGDPNRLGFALMLCYLRFPGRILQQGEQPPAALCAYVAEQLGLDAAHFGDYAERDQTRREHVLEIETALGLCPLTRVLYRKLAAWLLPTALVTDHGPTLVTTLLEELRARRIVCPSLAAIERLAGSVRARAQRQLWRRLADGLTDEQRQSLDQLLEVRAGGGQSTLAWLRQTAYAATTAYENLKDIQEVIRWLCYTKNWSDHNRYWARRSIRLLWASMHQALLQEFDREVPTYHVGKYVEGRQSVADILRSKEPLTGEQLGEAFKREEELQRERFIQWERGYAPWRRWRTTK